MAVFTPQAQAGSVELETSYLTEVIRSDNGTEQRAMYREIPSRKLRFTARTVELYRTGWLDALTYGAQGEELTVPYWPHASALTATATAGALVVLSLDTTDRDYQVNGYLVLWASERHAEECQIVAVGGSSVTVVTLAESWPTGTIVLPAFRGTFSGTLESGKLSGIAAETQMEFLLTTDPDDPNVTEITDAVVFTIVPVQHVEVSHTYESLVDRQTSPFYEHTDYRRRAYPVGARPYVLWLDSKAACAAITDWFHGLRGRLRPFWMPTYQHDFEVLSGFGTSTLVVAQCGYAARLFAGRERRHLAFFEPSGTITHLEVANAIDNGNGTESLFLAGSSPATTLMVSYLLYGRLADDALVLTWANSEVAECSLGLVELPSELTPPGIAPGLGSAIYEGFPPTVVIGDGVFPAPDVGSAIFEGFAPVVGTDAPQPGVAEGTFEGFAPLVFLGMNLSPGIAVGLFTGYAPAIARTPGTGGAIFTGFKPRVKTN